MTTADLGDPAPEGAAGPIDATAPGAVSPVGAGVLLVAAVVVAALISISVGRLIPFDEDDAVLEAIRPVPATPASASALVGVAPLVTFDGAGPALPAGWSAEAGAWTVEGGAARATDTAEEGALAVVAAPADVDLVQVTVRDPEAGAGLVVSYRDPDSYIALQVGRTGAIVQLVEVDGRPLQPRVLVTAELESADAPLVLAIRRTEDGYEATANGQRLGERTVEEADRPEPWRIGLVTGVRPAATTTTFDDLVVA